MEFFFGETEISEIFHSPFILHQQYNGIFFLERRNIFRNIFWPPLMELSKGSRNFQETDFSYHIKNILFFFFFNK